MSYEYLAALPIPANFWDRAKQLFTHTEFSYYVRLITAICATAGFIPYEPNIIRNIIGCSKAATAEAFLNKLMLFCDYRLLDISEVPEEFRVLVGVDAQYEGKILCLCKISAFAQHLQDKRRKLVIAADCSHKSRSQEKEKKSSKRKEKEIYITPHQDTVIKNTGENEIFSFSKFRDLWNRWAEHFGVAQFQRLNEKLREKFKTRQASFKREGAETEDFWINLLSAVAETSGGFYIGNNDGYRHCGTPWIITAKWLLDSDEHIERFINAVR